MLVSELIAKLQAMHDEHGDCPVITDGGGAGFYEISHEGMCVIPSTANWPKWCDEWRGKTLISLCGNG